MDVESHLTRGAWIEINDIQLSQPRDWVAPHTRCVDWNSNRANSYEKESGRTSHEVRGLKY